MRWRKKHWGIFRRQVEDQESGYVRVWAVPIAAVAWPLCTYFVAMASPPALSIATSIDRYLCAVTTPHKKLKDHFV
jgi:hypothetical protein